MYRRVKLKTEPFHVRVPVVWKMPTTQFFQDTDVTGTRS